MTTIDEMWAAFEAHKPAPEYAEAWATMCKERTFEAIEAASRAAPVGSAAWFAVGAAIDRVVAASEGWAAAADESAQKAINAIKREVKP
jgi:hypothetical protein